MTLSPRLIEAERKVSEAEDDLTLAYIHGIHAEIKAARNEYKAAIRERNEAFKEFLDTQPSE